MLIDGGVFGGYFGMIEQCNFKSKIKHHNVCGCNLTPKDLVCPGEDKCVIYQTYYMLASERSEQ